ncbi:hypothetical protein AZ003_002850 [Citrobacter freundii]|uniref:hypothetical protein n=1 Tax=Citrobacter freundii TaxID=546 RepID=UPI000A3B357B|nr:hypothetical protein [Citrobacter freundii]OUE53943.1 hypothetical protein AZ003_002850 [Citrobacter freundii]
MKHQVLSCIMLMGCLAAIFYCNPAKSPPINRSDLLLWRVMLYGLACAVGWYLYQHLPAHRPAIRRIALIFIILIVLNEIVPEVFR